MANLDSTSLALEVVAQLHLIGCPHVPAQDTLQALLRTSSRGFLQWMHTALHLLPDNAATASHPVPEQKGDEFGAEDRPAAGAVIMRRRAAQNAVLAAERDRLRALVEMLMQALSPAQSDAGDQGG